jgi:hypothetical protein
VGPASTTPDPPPVVGRGLSPKGAVICQATDEFPLPHPSYMEQERGEKVRVDGDGPAGRSTATEHHDSNLKEGT